ncbi:MAG: magnesium/cobalt transporter CorA [Spirochaetaceae bacterium]|nr:magnesium/cobalt transporter CorA [Spirochaetaceae bacterium]
MVLFQSKHFGRRRGLSPGTLLESGEEPAVLRLIRFGTEGILENRNIDAAELPAKESADSVVWIQMKGVHDSAALKSIGDAYGIHALTLEDVQNTDRRPGFDSLGDKLFVTTKRLLEGNSFSDLGAETISMILTGRTVICFLETSSMGHAGLESILDQNGGQLKRFGADYLAYRIWDDSIDTWLHSVELSENEILTLEEDVLFHYRDSLTEDIHEARKKMAWLRWTFRPFRDLRSWLQRFAPAHFSVIVEPFLLDLSDHVNRVSDLLDLYRDMTDDLMSMLIAVQSNRMNAVMKVLTIIATIFIPLTFIAGIYGMNFARMPELAWRWGYPAALGLMGLTALGMLIYFKVKKWL